MNNYKQLILYNNNQLGLVLRFDVLNLIFFLSFAWKIKQKKAN